MAQEKKYDVFISSKSEDYPIAEKVYDFLVANGLTVFLASTELSRIGEAEYSEAVDAAIDGLDSNKYKVNLILKDAKGAVVARTSAAAKQEQTLSLTLKNPKRWSLSEPYLYSLEAQIVMGKEVVDATTIPVGLRTLQFDADKGFARIGIRIFFDYKMWYIQQEDK